MTKTMETASGSFRDPGGQVFEDGGRIYRTIYQTYQDQWERVGPFLTAMAKKGLVLPFAEVSPLPGTWKTLLVETIPFISYPYEWSYDQMKDAALLTLELQRQALSMGLILKDASAYNVQFIGNRAVFIDLLSFEIWQEGTPWIAYKQFCSHFLAPLALTAVVDLRCTAMAKLWIDGIPLDLAAAMMPKKKRWNPGLNFHLFLHAGMQHKYSDTDKYAGKARSVTVTAKYLTGLADSLERLIQSKALALPEVTTEWGDYYNNTNYTEQAAQAKSRVVAETAADYSGGSLALDIGANTGQYSQLLLPHFSYVVAADIDPLAVTQHYRALKKTARQINMLPLIIDFSNPSADIGFMNQERTAFIRRCQADFVTALAVIHHLRITAGIPLPLLARFFAGLLNDNGILLLEFVPKEDSQTRKLLALREDVFSDYTLEQCQTIFADRFTCLEVRPVAGSCRNILTLKKRGRTDED